MKDRIEFYEKNTPILLPDSQWRQYRLELDDGRMIVLKRQIHKPEQLLKFIKIFKPKNVYQTISCFLDPVNLKGKKSPYRPIVISNLVFIDIDEKDEKEIKKVINFFKNKKEYRLLRIVSSGGGYHIYYEDLGLKMPVNPSEREEYIKKRRLKLENEMLKSKIKIDVGIMTDIYRVSRVANTWNGNKNKPCVLYALESSEKNDDISPEQNNVGELRSRVSNPDIIIYKFISNSVEGTKGLFVPYIEINKKRDPFKLTKKIQEIYKVGDIYIFETEKKYHLLGIKCFDFKRIRKILKYSKSENLKQFEKYKNLWIKTSDILKNDTVDKLKFVAVINQKVNGIFSKPHIDFLKKYGVECQQRVCGKEKNKIYLMVKNGNKRC